MVPALRGGRRFLVSAIVLLTCGAWSSVSPARAAESKADRPKPGPATKADPADSDAKEKLEAAMKKAMEEARQTYEKEKRQRQERLRTDPKWQASYEQVGVIEVNKDAKDRRTVYNFCLNKEGTLLVCCGARRQEPPFDPKATPVLSNESAQRGEIRLLSTEGKTLGVWELQFEPQAICTAQDGTIYAGGAGKLNKLDKDGTVLLAAESPNVAELPPLPGPREKGTEPKGKDAEAAEIAKQKKTAELQKKRQEALNEYQRIAEEARKSLIPDDEASIEAYEAKTKEPLEKYRALQEELTDFQSTPEMRVARLRAERERKLAITGMAVADRDVFLACLLPNGYGYAVWRTDTNFGSPKRIIGKLTGCCGLMDIHAHHGELWVAHNARHKVERYDRDGKKLASFGITDRLGADGFGGCCEPKNLRFAVDGELFAIESEPQLCVKRFTTSGKFLNVAVVAPWDSGCVQSTTEFKADEDKFFLLNSGRGTIHVFAKKKAAVGSSTAGTPRKDAK